MTTNKYHWVEYADSGAILVALTTQGDPEPPPVAMGGTMVSVPRPANPRTSLYVSGAVLDLGDPPSSEHRLDVENRAWVLPSSLPPLPPSQTQIVAALQTELDRVAGLYGYDDIRSAVSYRGDPNPKFAAEAEAFFVWRSDVWTTANAYAAQVAAGTAPYPSVPQAIAMMPPLGLPPPS